jgi:hypothetical protein
MISRREQTRELRRPPLAAFDVAFARDLWNVRIAPVASYSISSQRLGGGTQEHHPP